jgi:hypothetical protein
MRAELLEKIRVIRNNLVIITNNFLAWKAGFMNHKRAAIIPALVLGIPILANNYCGHKYLRKPLLAREQGYRHTTGYIRGFRIIIKAIWPVRYLASNYGYKFAYKIP